jgi:protease-4
MGYENQASGTSRSSEGSQEQEEGGGFFKGCLIVVVVLGLLGIFGSVALVGMLVAAVASATPSTAAGPRLREATVGGRPGAPKIACINVSGVIYGGRGRGGEISPVSVVTAKIKRAKADKEVRGVLLYVNSPGGEITGSDILHRAVQQYKKESGGQPVVACMMDVAASGGYYVAAAADHIVAHPTSITGSIGVMMPMYDLSELMEKVGVEDETLTTGPYKSLGSPFDQQSEEQERQEREILTGIIEEMHARFVEIVARGRGMEPEKVRELADGRIFTGQQAKELGLVDQVGYADAAIQSAKKLAGIQNAHLVRYQRVVSLGEFLSSLASGPRFSIELPGTTPLSERKSPLFLWRPEPGSHHKSPGTATGDSPSR